ncbi:MAG: phosphoribosylformylglycinamidine synthase [Myxococcota bacterium]|jgi:phosphoribosylformylglycinamidine synthase
MWTHRGGPARSAFRLEKLLVAVQREVPRVAALRADFVHLAHTARPLTVSETGRLEHLLSYGESPVPEPSRADLVVVPRPGTISPWSSKATEIVANCGLDAVHRVERGVSWSLQADGAPLTPSERTAASAPLHDRMTEAVLGSVGEASLLFAVQEPRHLRRVPVLEGGEAALQAANTDWGLALSADEIAYLVEAFRDLGRDPTDAELMMFAQANSEHCRHKIFNAQWTIDGAEQPHTLFGMIKHTHRANPGRTLSAYKDNAAVVAGPVSQRFGPNPYTRVYGATAEPVHLLMKVETHNHPTGISPHPGAGTGNGGEIRDEGATGRGGKPKAGLSGFWVSHLRLPDAPEPWEDLSPGNSPRMATALEIMTEGPIGGAQFNNEFGRPNLTGTFRTFEQQVAGADGPEWRGYHKPIMIAGGFGNVRDGHVQKRELPVGAKLVALGGPAMLIGLGGGAASSMATGDSDEDLDFASVQRANPEIERRCQEVIDRCWQLGAANPIASIHDVGAGGWSNAFPEIVHDAGRGGRFDLRALPNAEPGLSPMEIWVNEAQERYVLAIAPADLERFERLCVRERCPYAVVGEVTGDDRLSVTDGQLGEAPIDLPLSVLFGNPPRMHRDVRSVPVAHTPLDTTALDLQEAAVRVLRHPTVASKRFLITIGDRSITGMVAREQMVGPWQVPVADVAVTTTTYAGWTGEAMAMGERTPVALLDGPASARMAIGEALTNLVSADIVALGDVVLSANWMAPAGHPGEDANLYATVRAVGLETCPALGIHVPVGKDSMSMRAVWTDDEGDHRVTAPLSLVISAFVPVADVRRTLTPQLSRDLDTALLLVDLGDGRNRLGGSMLAQVHGELGATPPDLDDPARLVAFIEALDAVRDQVLAYHDRSDGGLLATVAEMAFAGRTGVDVSLPGDDAAAALFAEELGAVLQVHTDDLDAVYEAFADRGLGRMVHALGSPNADRVIRFRHGKTIVASGTRAHWERAWSTVSWQIARNRDNPVCADSEHALLLATDDPGLSPVLTFDPAWVPPHDSGRPQVAILREQGVNGQLEMAAAFHRAGFDAVDVHMSDLLAGRVDLGDFRGLVACGGFSFGDVLGAGGGWAKSILNHGLARAAFQAFFERDDTFSLGVCNGCQMLSQLAELIPGAGDWPRFERNASEQFEARTSLVEVLDSPSILLQGMAGSRLPIAVAHGEGRVVHAGAPGVAAARFVDNRGRPTEIYPLNPNGSPGGLTGFTSADGRATILMPHPERVFRTVTNSWAPAEWGVDGPWMRMFRNARAWCG